jgi:hypothetical protein
LFLHPRLAGVVFQKEGHDGWRKTGRPVYIAGSSPIRKLREDQFFINCSVPNDSGT